jgi:hypothetical protein
VAELLELADVGKHRAVVGAVVVDNGNCGGWFARFGHGTLSLLRDHCTATPARSMPTVTEEG